MSSWYRQILMNDNHRPAYSQNIRYSAWFFWSKGNLKQKLYSIKTTVISILFKTRQRNQMCFHNEGKFYQRKVSKKTKVYRCNVTRYFVCAVYCPRMCPNSLNLTTKLLYTFLQVIFVRIRMETFSRVSRNFSLPTDNECV